MTPSERLLQQQQQLPHQDPIQHPPPPPLSSSSFRQHQHDYPNHHSQSIHHSAFSPTSHESPEERSLHTSQRRPHESHPGSPSEPYLYLAQPHHTSFQHSQDYSERRQHHPSRPDSFPFPEQTPPARQLDSQHSSPRGQEWFSPTDPSPVQQRPSWQIRPVKINQRRALSPTDHLPHDALPKHSPDSVHKYGPTPRHLTQRSEELAHPSQSYDAPPSYVVANNGGQTDVDRVQIHTHRSQATVLSHSPTPPLWTQQQRPHARTDSYQNESMEHACPETDSGMGRTPAAANESYTHAVTNSGSNRHYVLTSVASSASFTQRRLSVNLSPIHIPPDSTDGGEAYTTTTSSSSLSSSVSTLPPSYSASLQQTPPYSHWHDSEERSMNQTRDQRQRIAPPPPILTKLGNRPDCPSLSFQTHSGQSLSSNSAGSKMSPSTPRSILLPGIVSRSTLDGSHMAFDLSKTNFPGHPIHPSQLTQLTHLTHPLRYLTPSPAEDCAMMEPEGDHDMEHCSEQDDVREREHEQDEDEDDEENDVELMGQRKVMKIQQDSSARGSLENASSFQQRIVSPINRSNHRSQQFMHEDDDEEEEAAEEDADGEEADTTIASSSSGRRMGLAKSPLRDEAKAGKKAARSKAVPRKRAPRQGSAQTVLEEALAEQEEDGQGQDGAGSQSLHGKGLGYYAPLVCDHVKAKGFTTYNDVVYELAAGASGDASVIPPGGQNGDGPAAQEPSGQGNIRRRVYDALNILEALGIISMDKKEIRWIGIQEANAIRKVQDACDASQGLHQQERDVANESEEPEDDEMEIDQLQKEVEALRLRNALELAQLQDQVARHVQLNNLVSRNKQKETKEQEREERRRQKKLDRKAEKRLQAEATGTQETTDDTGQPNGESRRRTEKRHHHRCRSPRPDKDGDEDMVAEEEGDDSVKETDEEKARRRQEKKERRERKERRAQKRQEKEAKAEAERIQMPYVMVRMPGYAGQSSDSEASITVVRRRVREEQKPRKSGKSKRHSGEETSVVEITIPRQDEMSIISDTEILGDLGLSNVSMTDLRAMLPQEVVEKARYTSASADGSLDRVTLQGGFERAMVLSGTL